MKSLKLTIIAALAIAAMNASAQPSTLKTRYANNECHFIILNDAGVNGHKNHKTVADLMGTVASYANAKFVVCPGDQLHMQGAISVQDPIWITNYEMIYTNPSLLWIPWYEVAGNHEYNGNVQALIDYSNVSRRWHMPSRYYSFVENDPKSGAKIRFVMCDTTPMQVNPKGNDHSDASKQDVEAQLKWIEETLNTPCDADWTIVIGHHPVFANTGKSIKQQQMMQAKLLPILKRHPEVDYYICGHIHIFEHIIKEGISTEFVVNASAGTGRTIVEGQETPLFSYGDSGFLMVSFDKTHMSFDLIDKEGNILYTFSKKK